MTPFAAQILFGLALAAALTGLILHWTDRFTPRR